MALFGSAMIRRPMHKYMAVIHSKPFPTLTYARKEDTERYISLYERDDVDAKETADCRVVRAVEQKILATQDKLFSTPMTLISL
jgi:hypothetical protein